MAPTQNHGEEEPGAGHEAGEGMSNRALGSMSMRRKVILAGLAYFCLLIIAAAVASPAFLRLIGRSIPAIAPVASLYLPHVQHGSISPQGDRIAVATTNGIEIRDLANGELQERLGDERVDRVAWSPNGRRIAAVDREAISVWDLERAQRPVICRIPYPHVEFAWFPDSLRIATISRDLESLIIWDTQRDVLLHRIVAPQGYWICDTVAVSPRAIATAWSCKEEKKATIALWDAETYKATRSREIATASTPAGCYAGRQAVYKMSWSPNGTILSYLVANCPWTRHEWFTLQLWPITPEPGSEPFTPAMETEGDGLWISSYSWSPSGLSLAMVFNMSKSLGVYSFKDHTVKHISLEGELQATGNFNQVIGFTPDGERLGVALDLRNMIQILDSETMEQVLGLTEYGGPVNSVDLSPDKTLLGVLDGYGSVKLIDARSGHVTEIFQVDQNLGGGLRFSDTGEEILVWTDESVVIWNMARGDFDTVWSIPESQEEAEEADGEGGGPASGDYPWRVSQLSPDNSQIAIIRVGDDRRIKAIEIRDTNTGQLVTARDIPPITGDTWNKMGGSIIEWSPSQELIGFTDYKEIFVWNLTSNVITKMGSHPNITSFAFHPQLDLLASTGKNNKTLLWDLRTGKPLAKLDKALYGVVFSPDGSMILGDSGIYNSTTLNPIYTLPTRKTSIGMAWDKAGRTVVTLTPFNGPISIYDIPQTS